MLEFLLLMLLGAFVLAFYLFIGEKKVEDKKITIMYGYPGNCRTWLTVYHRRGSDEWIFEWDDLFDGGRPRSMYPLSRHIMVKNTGVATEEEIKIAKAMLKRRKYV